MEGINIYQNNNNGDNYFYLSIDKALRPYDKVLSVGAEKMFLDDASENLIRDKKLYRNNDYINKVEQYLDEKKFCLIKAPEGRGKTYLSRIIAYDYHTIRKMKVYFLDLKKYNNISDTEIDDKLQEWHTNKNNNYLIVIENVHAYKYLRELLGLIYQWINPTENRIWFLLNARPTDDELDVYSEWKEIVELKPNKKVVNGIVNLYSREVMREPFANDEERKTFVEEIYPDKTKASGANLRLLRIYLKTWQNHPEIQFISGVSKTTVTNDFKLFYLSDRTKDEIKALWYISSLYQFDVPLHEDFVQSVGNLVGEGLLRFEGNRYHLPHSVDATFLYKAICDYKGKDDYVDQMKTFAECFINDILATKCPSDFESDFKLFISGLTTRNNEFMNVIYYLNREDIAEIIIKRINSLFVLLFFRPFNHEKPNSDALKIYYHNNKKWLIPLFLKYSSGILDKIDAIFRKRLGYCNVVKDIFEDANDLDNYLSANNKYNSLINIKFLRSIAKLGTGHRTILIYHYIKNKVMIKPLLLGINHTSLSFVCMFYLKLGYDIIKNIFEFIDDLDAYLNVNNNYKLLIDNRLFILIARLGAGHRIILLYHYEKNKVLLKPMLLGLTPTRLVFAFFSYKNHLKYDIVKDIFEDAKDLDDYLKNYEGYKFQDDDFLRSIMELGDEHKRVLEKHNAYSYFFYTKPTNKSFRVNQQYILQFLSKRRTFEVSHIKNNRFYFDGVSWSYLQRFVSVIKNNMTTENRQQSVNMVKTIIDMVLTEGNALSYATAIDLSYFYNNIASVDETIFQKLAENHLVQTDIKRRLEASSYSAGDLYLFDLFFSQSWCKEKLEPRILNADNGQQKIIKAWHDEFVKKLKDQGKEITSGSLLDYIHRNPAFQGSFPEDRA